MILLVQLDPSAGTPANHEALRVVGNLVTPEGDFCVAPTRRRPTGAILAASGSPTEEERHARLEPPPL